MPGLPLWNRPSQSTVFRNLAFWNRPLQSLLLLSLFLRNLGLWSLSRLGLPSIRLPLRSLPCLGLAAALLLTACGSRQASPPYSLEGPPLAIAAEQDGRFFTGRMERSAMLGQGEVFLQPLATTEGDGTEQFVCHGSIQASPNKNGHFQGGLSCSNSNALMFSFRNLGPDQGIGLGSFIQPAENNRVIGGPLLFYFHPWQKEARRRLEQEKDSLLAIIRKGQNK